MVSFNRMSIINEYQCLKEEKENLEVELHDFLSSIVGRSATYEELKKEVQYRKDISICEYKMRHLENEFKVVSAIRSGILILGLFGAIALAAISTKCAKENNKISDSDDVYSVSTEEELETKKELIKTLK